MIDFNFEEILEDIDWSEEELRQILFPKIKEIKDFINTEPEYYSNEMILDIIKEIYLKGQTDIVKYISKSEHYSLNFVYEKED